MAPEHTRKRQSNSSVIPQLATYSEELSINPSIVPMRPGFGHSLSSIQVEQYADAQRQEDKESVFSGISGAFSFAKKLLDNNVVKDLPIIGSAFEGVSEATQRIGKGEDAISAIGGGIAKTGADVVADSVKIAESATASGVGLVGSALKFISSASGEKEGPDLTIKDTGELLELGSTVVSRGGILGHGFKEAVADTYDVGLAMGRSIREGSLDPFAKMGEDWLKNSDRPITQGYTMAVGVMRDLFTGNHEQLNHIDDLAMAGNAGGLAKLGARSGLWLGDLVDPRERQNYRGLFPPGSKKTPE